jgi:hypothetical protein
MLLGCGDKSSPTSSSDLLDTSPKQYEGTFQIQRWNTQTLIWEYTTDVVTVNSEWRFVSSRSTKSDVVVNGGYKITWDNSTIEKVNVYVEKLIFSDGNGIPVFEVPLDDNFPINPKSTVMRAGTFVIVLANIRVSWEVMMLYPWASVTYQP